VQSNDADTARHEEHTFAATQWTTVLSARDEQLGKAGSAALNRLCATYWLPIYHFIRRAELPGYEAEDLTQEFFSDFLERGSLRGVSPQKGRFRSFLLACAKHFLGRKRERAYAARRGGGWTPILFKAAIADPQSTEQVTETVTPDIEFDRHWADALLRRVINELELEYSKRGRAVAFSILEQFLPGANVPLSPTEAAARLGVPVATLNVYIHRLRHRLAAHLRREVARTVSSPDQLDAELRYLVRVISC
jgi:RNA polymerase sigma-70 factor (ECF subfamily)